MILRSLLLFAWSSQIAIAQAGNGDCDKNLKLFASYQDFADSTPSDGMCLSDRENKISKYWGRIVLKEGKNKRKYTHGSLWGYQNQTSVYRYFDEGKTFGGAYGYLELVSSDGLFLWAFRDTYTYFGGTYRVHYYYSTDIDAPIKKLSLTNLESDVAIADFFQDVKEVVEDLATTMSSTVDQDAVNKFNAQYRSYFPDAS